MPWCQKPKKGVVHCDKPRVAVCRRYYPGIPEWGNPPGVGNLAQAPPAEYIGGTGGNVGN